MTHPQGAVRVRRFLGLVVPATLACLGVVAGIALGWITVAFASVEPVDFATSEGTATSLSLEPGSETVLTGLTVGDGPRPAAMLRVTGTRLEDLCLVPRVRLPVLGEVGSLRIRTSRRVDLDDVSLAATDASVSGIRLPTTVIGGVTGEGGTPGGFSVRSAGPGGVHLDGTTLRAYGIVLADGISLRSLGLRPGLGDQAC